MRVLFSIIAVALVTSRAGADDSIDRAVKHVPWQAPFVTIDASDSDRALVLVVVTNEDPFAAKDASQSENQQVPPVWCAGVLANSYLRATNSRTDLEGRITIQSIAAGLPKEITGGDARNAPARAVLALCDHEYRLLSVMVGVPDANELLTLIEDGEDVASIRELNEDQPTVLANTIVERSRERLSRLWNSALNEMAATLLDEDDDEQAEEAFELDNARAQALIAGLEPTYIADVRLRFGLRDASDQTRLIVLEQHPQARRPWCEAMMPFIAGINFQESWPLLVESIWGHQPIAADGQAQELLDWYDARSKSEAVVLGVQPPIQLQHIAWPPTSNKNKRGVGWQTAHELAQQFSFRSVDLQELALLVRSRDLKAIDVALPSRARYIFLESKNKKPMAIREQDPPGRFAGILKRSKPKPTN